MTLFVEPGTIIFMSRSLHKTKIFGLANNTIWYHATFLKQGTGQILHPYQSNNLFKCIFSPSQSFLLKYVSKTFLNFVLDFMENPISEYENQDIEQAVKK